MRFSRRTSFVVAWTGAAIFAASLAWFAYCYLVRYGRPAPPGPLVRPILVNVLLFSVFALHHSLLARSGAKEIVRSIVPGELERSLYTWVASILFLAVCTWWQPVPGVIYDLTGVWKWAAYAVQLLGIFLTLRAARALDALDLAGVRAVQHAAGRANQPDVPTLSTHGLYGFVRHPLYFAWALFVFSTPTMTGTRASFAIISTAYLMLAIPWEERALVATFGHEYQDYRRRIKTRMIPWVY